MKYKQDKVGRAIFAICSSLFSFAGLLNAFLKEFELMGILLIAGLLFYIANRIDDYIELYHHNLPQ